MINIDNKKNCCSCSACVNICPKNAIYMKEDSEGFKYPFVDLEKCVNCGLCNKVCPFLSNQASKNSKEPAVFAAWSKDVNIRIDSTSGGIFSEIAKIVYSKNGVVCGAVYDPNWMVNHYVSKDIRDLEKLRSSKYLQSEIGDTFKTIKYELDNNKLVLFCGSPCQVKGLLNFLQKDYENLITIDFICRGMNSPKIFKKYITMLESKYKSKIKNIKFKDKIYGWHNFSTKIEFENGKSYIGSRYLDSYMVGYLKYNAFMRLSCYDCKFKGLPRYSDITLADFWGIENIRKDLDQDKGTSMVLANTTKGEKILKDISKSIIIEKIDSNKAFDENQCFTKSVVKTKNRDYVFDNIDKMEYKELSKKFFPTPKGLKRIKLEIKKLKRYIKLKDRG